MNRLGTPTDLREAIARGLNEILGERIAERNSAEVKLMHDIIQDRLAQSFQAHMCSGSAEKRQGLTDLWRAIFPKKMSPS